MKSFVGYVINKTIKAIPRSKKVSPDIKSVKPTKDVKGSVKRTKQDQYLKNINDLNKAQKKITEGKKLVKEGVKSRKQMVGTKRAFQFKNIKSYHAVEPGSKKINPASIKQEKTKKFKKGKELEREKKMGGGMMGRRMGYTMGSSVKPALKKIKKLMDESKAKKQDAARVKKMGGGMMGRRFGYKSGMSVKGDDKRDIRKVEQMTGASKSSKREKGLIGRQSVIAKQAGDPKKIESVDFKVLQAKRKNKKKVI